MVTGDEDEKSKDPARKVFKSGKLTKLERLIALLASLIALIAFFFGITRIAGEERSLIPPSSVPTHSSTGVPSPSESEDPPPTPDRAALKARYITAADAVCLVWFKKNAEDRNSYGRTMQYAHALVQNFESMLVEWEAVPAPVTEDAVVRPIISDLRSGNMLYAEALDAHDQSDAEAYRTAEARSKSITSSATERAKQFGFRVCAIYD
jgi:hypothetical protein